MEDGIASNILAPASMYWHSSNFNSLKGEKNKRTFSDSKSKSFHFAGSVSGISASANENSFRE